MNYKVILNHDQTYYFKSLEGVLRFIRLLDEETIYFSKKTDIQIYDMKEVPVD